MKTLLALLLIGAPVYALPLAAQATTPDCAVYTYTGTSVTLCHDFPGDTDRDCSAIGHPVSLTPGVDPWELSNGGVSKVGCEDYPSYVPVKVSHSASPKPSVTPSRTAKLSLSHHASSSAPVGGALAVTGPPIGLLAAGGVAVLGIGALGFVMARRRKVKFSA